MTTPNALLGRAAWPGVTSWRRWWPAQAAMGIWLGMAVVGATYLAMEFEFERPEWAAWTVLSVTLATRASSLQKSLWRCVSTLIGAIASVLLTSAFAQDTLAFDIALAGWLAAATLLSSVTRGQGAYGFALMGFTVPIITLAEVAQPLSVFSTAVDRCLTLLLGVVCAYAAAAPLAAGVPAVRAAVAGRMAAAAVACRAWMEAGQVHGTWGPPPVAPVLDLDAAVTDAFTEQPSLRCGGQAMRDAPRVLLAMIASGLLQARLPPHCRASNGELLEWPLPGPRWKPRRVAAVARMLRQGGRVGSKRTHTPALDHDRDWRLALNNAVRTAIAISLVSAFWYVSEWSSGGAAVTWVGISSILLANRENSAEATYHFLLGAALAELVGTTLHYTVLTFTGDFRLLAATLFPLGMLAAVGRGDARVQVGGGFGLVVFAALEPLNRMEFDFGASLNGVVATLLGLGAAVFAFSALPPPASPALRRHRTRRRIVRALGAAARRPRPLLPHPSHWCACMLERAGLLAPEGDAAVAAAHTLTVAGLLLLSLRREQGALGLEAGRIVLAGGHGLAGRLMTLAEQADGVQRSRLMALAALFPGGLPPGFPRLSVAAT